MRKGGAACPLFGFSRKHRSLSRARVVVSFEDLPSSATIRSLTRLVNSLSRALTEERFTHQGIAYMVVHGSILFPDADVVHSLYFGPEEPPGAWISGTALAGQTRLTVTVSPSPLG